MGQPSETPNTKKLEIRSLLAPKKFFNEIFNVFNLNQLLWSPMTSRLLVRFLAPTFPQKNAAKIFTHVNTHPQNQWNQFLFVLFIYVLAALLALKTGRTHVHSLTNTIFDYILTIHVRYRYLHIHINGDL